MRMRNRGEIEKRLPRGKPLGVEDTGRIFFNLCSPKKPDNFINLFSSQFINKVEIYVHAQPFNISQLETGAQ